MDDYINVEEIWKDIVGYEGLYQVSNLGRVKSLQRVVYYKPSNSRNTKGCHTVPEQIKKISLKKRGSQRGKGYYVVNLYKNNEGENRYIHRLVAEAFIPNPENKETVNHIDGNKENNTVKNLEWATYQKNNEHAIENHLIDFSNRKNNSKNKPVRQYNLQWELIKEYPSMREAQRETGCDATQIGKCCRNKDKTSGGFHWSYN